MKRAVEEASECKKPSIITFGDVDREAITKLRNDIRSCARALQGGCDGVQRFNPQYFEDLIDALSDDIVNCDRELEKGWFGGFVKMVDAKRRVMVTTPRIRKVSVEVNNYPRCICVLTLSNFVRYASTGNRGSPR